MEAWIKVYHDLSDHPKTYALADALKVEQFAAVGIVVCLWTWAVIHAPDGDLSRFPDAAIARACHWNKPAAGLAKALQESGFLDGRRIHDWEEYAGDLMDAIEIHKEKTRKRVEAYRERKRAAEALRLENGNVTCNADVTLQPVTDSVTGNADVTPGNALRTRTRTRTITRDMDNTHTDFQPSTRARARTREADWFDPENPDAECDTGWLSEKSRPAIAQRIMDWACRRDGFDTLPEADKYGRIGPHLLDMISGAMACGIHPAEITKALQSIGSLTECERQVAGMIRETVGIDGLKEISQEWGQRAWAEYQEELKNARAFV